MLSLHKGDMYLDGLDSLLRAPLKVSRHKGILTLDGLLTSACHQPKASLGMKVALSFRTNRSVSGSSGYSPIKGRSSPTHGMEATKTLHSLGDLFWLRDGYGRFHQYGGSHQ